MKKLVVLLSMLMSLAVGANATLSATGSLTWSSVGSIYTYSITLVNNGTTNIGTFWLGWTFSGNYLPTMPTIAGSPVGWSGSLTNAGAGDGWGVEWSTATPLAAGQTLTGFKFSTTSTPSQILATSPFHPGPATSSYVFIGAAFGDSGYEFTVTGPASVAVAGLALTASGIVGGNNTTGTVTLTDVAPTGGTSVNLSSLAINAATVAATVTVAAGLKTATFPITTLGVDTAANASIGASAGGATKTATLVVNPAALYTITTVTPVIGGHMPATRVILNGKAGPSGKVVPTGTSSSVATVPTSVTVTSQTSAAAVTVNTAGVDVATSTTLTAGSSPSAKSVGLTVEPAVLSTLVVSPAAVIGGTAAKGLVTFTGKSGNATSLSLQSNSSAATVASSALMTAQSFSGSFSIATHATAADTSVTISSTLRGVTKTASLLVKAPILSVLSISPNVVVGGNGSTKGTVSLTGPAPTNGFVVNLSDNSSFASTPASVTVPSGLSTTTFTISTLNVTSQQTDTIAASAGAVTLHANLVLRPWLASFGISPSSIAAGASTTGTVTLYAPAPTGGEVVAITTNKAAVTVPASLTVAAGQTKGTFTITGSGVSAYTTVTVTVALKGVAKSANVSVTPAP